MLDKAAVMFLFVAPFGLRAILSSSRGVCVLAVCVKLSINYVFLLSCVLCSSSGCFVFGLWSQIFNFRQPSA